MPLDQYKMPSWELFDFCRYVVWNALQQRGVVLQNSGGSYVDLRVDCDQAMHNTSQYFPDLVAQWR